MQETSSRHVTPTNLIYVYVLSESRFFTFYHKSRWKLKYTNHYEICEDKIAIMATKFISKRLNHINCSDTVQNFF